ncbi:MAG TPA: outer membrane beta-barrel protein [Vicinamibacterales bacterium]|nr:outer membrane beta-barrel protein [Vicinamibacterales bacterium]
MRSTRAGRFLFILSFVFALAAAAPASAQFGVGARLAMVHREVNGDDDAVRFTGGQIRLGSSRTAFELSFDRRSETFDLLNEKVKETPIQASLLLYLARGGFAPYLLGGPGWYKRTVESLDDSAESVSTTTFGWHAGFGAELRMGGHAGLHADYRYTHLSFDDDEEEGGSFLGNLLPSHDGSMWTVGFTFYF